jgi:hypothetical protein
VRRISDAVERAGRVGRVISSIVFVSEMDGLTPRAARRLTHAVADVDGVLTVALIVPRIAWVTSFGALAEVSVVSLAPELEARAARCASDFVAQLPGWIDARYRLVPTWSAFAAVALEYDRVVVDPLPPRRIDRRRLRRACQFESLDAARWTALVRN